MKIYKLIKNDIVVYIGTTIQKSIQTRSVVHRIGTTQYNGGGGTTKKDFDTCELIEETDDDTREEYWIKFYDTFHNGLNKTEDGKVNSTKRIRVWNSEFDKTYNSLMDASRELKLRPGNLSEAANGYRKHVKGYKAEYKNEKGEI